MMRPHLTRRDFLKLAGALPLAPFLGRLPASGLDARRYQDPKPPNVIVLLFDALTASNLSLHGYPRKTCPNLERFAQRSTVYHAHHSAGNFTTPSTASLFTSTYPWTHRALELNGLISQEVKPNNIFRALREVYYQVAFTQNLYADTLLYQFQEHLDRHQDLDSYSLAGHTLYNKLFDNDAIYGIKSFDQFLFKREEAHGSLFLSILNDLSILLPKLIRTDQLEDIHPNGLPRLANTDVYFLLDQVIDGVMELLADTPSPSFTYIHLMPPHEPYLPTSQFLGVFEDGWKPEPKKRHRLAPRLSEERLNERRQDYDEFIANLDYEFGRLLDFMEDEGILDDSYVIVTSDHGELFERGYHGHSLPALFEPVIRVPLVISAPGQRQREDIQALTSNVDILPTLLHLAGLPIPDWCEGRVLPGLGGVEDPDRSIYVVEAKANAAYEPLTKATVALIKGNYKLVHYFGYKHYQDNYEFYDLDDDPEELNDRYPSHPAVGELQAELDRKVEEVNLIYQ